MNHAIEYIMRIHRSDGSVVIHGARRVNWRRGIHQVMREVRGAMRTICAVRGECGIDNCWQALLPQVLRVCAARRLNSQAGLEVAAFVVEWLWSRIARHAVRQQRLRDYAGQRVATPPRCVRAQKRCRRANQQARKVLALCFLPRFCRALLPARRSSTLRSGRGQCGGKGHPPSQN